MSELRKKIMPYAAKLLSSDLLLSVKRRIAEVKRKVSGKPHQIDVFIAGTDPYSYLLTQLLPELASRFNLTVKIHVVRDLQEDMFPDYPKWQANSLVDADRLATLYKIDSPLKDGVDYSAVAASSVTWHLLAAEKSAEPMKEIQTILSEYWAGKCAAVEPNPRDPQLLEENQGLLKKLGHYYPAMVHYGREWYWGIDRLDHLERRLNALGLGGNNPVVKYNLQTQTFCSGARHQTENAIDETPLEIFFSARSPYSYLGLLQAEKLTKYYNVPFKIKPVLPMMMRGMFVPDTKKMYIFNDTKREAKKLGIEYGFVADPLGEAVENCYSIYPYAESKGKEVEFLLAFSRAVNSEGIRADQEQGLQIIIERCGLDWQEAKTHLGNENWRSRVESNFDELQRFGLWGVPCFRYGDTVTWGQDRMWLLEKVIIDSKH